MFNKLLRQPLMPLDGYTNILLHIYAFNPYQLHLTTQLQLQTSMWANFFVDGGARLNKLEGLDRKSN